MNRCLVTGLVLALTAATGAAAAPEELVPDSVWKTHVYHLNRALNYRALLDAYAERCPDQPQPPVADHAFISMLVMDRMRLSLAKLDFEQVLRKRVFAEHGQQRAKEELEELGGCDSQRLPTHLERVGTRLTEELAAFAKLPELTRNEVRYGLGLDPQR